MFESQITQYLHVVRPSLFNLKITKHYIIIIIIIIMYLLYVWYLHLYT